MRAPFSTPSWGCGVAIGEGTGPPAPGPPAASPGSPAPGAGGFPPSGDMSGPTMEPDCASEIRRCQIGERKQGEKKRAPKRPFSDRRAWSGALNLLAFVSASTACHGGLLSCERIGLAARSKHLAPEFLVAPVRILAPSPPAAVAAYYALSTGLISLAPVLS